MPLRSVEAATRDDAIAAAREQFGPQTRVVGVRRVRSGGVLGFFATERYVAEVAPEQAVRPPVRGTTDPDDAMPADFSSPLASAAPARARASAPARNGAAAWAAEAVRSSDPAPHAAAPAPARSAFPAAARRSTPAESATRTARQVDDSSDDDSRLSELAGLLTPRPAEPETPSYARVPYPRASFPRTGSTATAPAGGGDETRAPVRAGDDGIPSAEPAAPSPFTAALARMVAGDRDVRQAVRQALEQPANRPDGEAGAWPAWFGPLAPADAPVPPPAAPQKEETVGNQVIAPPSMPTATPPAEVPSWAAEPELAPAPGSAREEAIAEILRAALAQGHSDEALAGILRKVLAGASPQAALTVAEVDRRVPALEASAVSAPAAGPVAPAVPAPAPSSVGVLAPLPLSVAEFAPTLLAPPVPEPTAVETTVVPAVETTAVVPAAGTPGAVEAVVIEPLAAAPPAVDAVVPEPLVEAPPVVEPAVVEPPVLDLPERLAPAQPLAAAPASAAAPAPRIFFGSMWGEFPSQATLWGEAAASVPPVTAPAPAVAPVAPALASGVATDAPIWAEVVQPKPVVAEPTPAIEEPVDPSAIEEPVDVPVVDAPVVDATVVADATGSAAVPEVEAPVVDEQMAEAEVAELAPVLARTASDPAPMVSLDSTTVMPPLTLLPPLPSSRGRGRGRPPVPPTTSRRAAHLVGPSLPGPSSTGRSDPSGPAPTDTTPTDTTPAVIAAPEPGATTDGADRIAAPATGSLATVTRLPVGPLIAATDPPDRTEHLDADDVAGEPADEPAAAPVLANGDVAGRLVTLGVPETLLGPAFADEVAAHGTYAALTQALAAGLPQPPELPTGAGEVIFVVGPGVDTLRAARSLATSLRLDSERVQWATRGDLAGLAPASSRMTTIEAAIDRRQDASQAGTVTVVAVDAPLRPDAYWMAQMMTIWAPTAVWALVDATRKPEDLGPWFDGLPQVDAVIVEDTDLSSDPAAVLRRLAAPVGIVDGVRATPHRWASLLCERLEGRPA